MAQDKPKRRFALTPTSTNSPAAVRGFGGNSYGFAVTERRLFGSVTDDVVSGGVTDTPVNPLSGSITLTGYVPVIARTDNQAVLPSVGGMTITGFAPSVTQGAGQVVNPSVGNLTLTGYSPTVGQSANQSVQPLNGSLSLTGYAPSIAQSANQAVSPNVGSLTIAGYAPSVVQAGGSVSITPDAGFLTITGYAPDVVQSGAITPSSQELSYSTPKPKKTKAKSLGGHYWKPEELAQIEPLVTKQPIAKLPAKEPEPITPKPRINQLDTVVSAHSALADIGIHYRQTPVDYSQVIAQIQAEIQQQRDDDDYAIATLMAMLL